MSVSTALSSSYAGELTPTEAWNRLKRDPRARLIDVRTQAEWAFVGLPDLSELGQKVVQVSWQLFPDMRPNPDFLSQLAAAGLDPEAPVLLLCRSGARSRAAAEYLTEVGYQECWNITDGFEGATDSRSHRGSVSGWKASTLPWRQG